MFMKSKNIFRLAFAILASQAAGFIGALFTTPAIESWYLTITKPEWNPPGWVFGPVWFILYTLMGIALYLAWHQGLHSKRSRFAFWFFFVHLGINALWSIVFFGMHNIALALGVIALLWGMIATLAILFWKIDKRAAYLLLPYLAWVSFATYLNYSIWLLNK